MNLLPDHPRFVFCATDMAFGASFTFDRDRVGSLSGLDTVGANIRHPAQNSPKEWRHHGRVRITKHEYAPPRGFKENGH